MKLQTKLIAAFSLLAAITLAVSIVGYWQARNLASALYEVGAVRLPSIQGLDMINEGMTAIKGSGQTLLVSGIDSATMGEQLEQQRRAWERVEKGWKLYEPLPQTDEEAVKWKAFVPAWNTWKKDHDSMMLLVRKGYHEKNPALLAAARAQRRLTTDALARVAETLLNEITAINDQIVHDAKERSIASREDMVTVQNIMVGSAALGVLGAFYLGFFMGRMFSKPIMQMADALDKIAKGDFTTKVPVRSHDEIGQMAVAMNDMVEALRTSEARLRALSDNLPNGMVYQVVREHDGTMHFQYVSAGVERLNGITAAAVLRDAATIYGQILLEDRPIVAEAEETSARESSEFNVVVRLRRTDGELRWMQISSSPRRLPDGRVLWDGIETDVTERKQAEILMAGEAKVLEMIATGEPLSKILDTVTRNIEEQSSGLLCTILLLDPDGIHLRHGAAPSIAREYVQAIDGAAIGPNAGSCGTAAYWKKPVFVSDIATDPLWADYKELALSHGLRACWSTPLQSASGRVLGTFAMYYAEPRNPAPSDIDLIERTIHVAGIAIERKQAEEALAESEGRYRHIIEASNDGIWEWDIDTNSVTWSDRVYEMFRMPKASFGGTFDAVNELMHPEDRPQFAEAVRGHLEQNLPYDVELRIRCGDSSYGYYLCRGKATRDPSGKPLKMIGSIEDITTRKVAEEALQQSRTDLSEAQRLAHLGNWTWTVENDTITWSEEVYHITGRDPAQAPPSSLAERSKFYTPATWARYQAMVEHAVKTGSPYELDMELMRGDGSTRWISARGEAQRNASGNVVKLRGTIQDITERKQSEDSLRQSEERLRHVIEASNDGIWERNLVTNAVTWSDRVYEMFMIARGSFDGTFAGVLDRAHPEDRPRMAEAFRAHIEDKLPYSLELRFRRGDGRYGHFLVRGKALEDSLGRSVRMIGSISDITERKRAEEALASSEALLRQFIKHTPAAVAMFDTEMRYLQASSRWLSDYHLHDDDIVGKSHYEVFPDIPERWKEVHRRVLAGAVERCDEDPFPRDDGTTDWLQWEVRPWHDVEGAIGGLIMFTQVITERKLAEVRMEQQARLLDIARDAIIVRDMNDKLLFYNRAAEQLYGWTFDEARTPSMSFMVEGDQEKFLQGIREFMEKGEWEGELRQRTKSGKEVIIQTRWTLVRDKDGKPAARLIINRDVTEHRKLEAQFRRTQRLESLGTLAGGIAHDLNNVLAPIMMSLAILDRKVADPSVKQWIASLETSAKRGSEIIKQVLMFARGSEREFAPQQLRYVIREIVAIIHQTFPKSIELRTDIANDLYYVNGDATQIHQVLMNLSVNARDAMPNGGQLTISASNVILGDEDAAMQPRGKPGPYLALSISDTGTGIPREIHEKIFEPFFTTKEVGKGTGLGLSTVYSIITDHKGFINLYSEMGKGTSFKIYLPAIHQGEIAGPSGVQSTSPSGNGEVILVVDDEQSVVQFSKDILEMHGYNVFTASNGVEAVDLFKGFESGSINLVLTDINMPRMDGLTAGKAMRLHDPGIKVVFASGLVTDLDEAMLAALNFHGYLTKPYTAQKMLMTIQEALQKI